MRSAKVSLRITLLSCIVILLLMTLSIVWISATRGLRASIEIMAQATSHEALARVGEQTKAQLDNAQAAGTLAGQRILLLERNRGRALRHSDLPEVTAILRRIIQVYPGLSYLSVSFAERGEYAHVQRNGSELSAVEMTRPINGVATQRYVKFRNGARTITRIDTNHRYDPRTRPFFKDAVRAGKSVWTDSYPFVEAGDVTYPGLSLAMPFYSGERLSYVVTADFTSSKLCHFLQGVKVAQTGYAFVVDDRSNGGHVLLAHPNPDILLQKKGNVTELARVGQLKDAVLRTVMADIIKYRDKSGAFAGKVSHDTGSVAPADEYFISYSRLENEPGAPAPGLSIGTIIPAAELTGPLGNHERTITAVGIIAVGLGLIVSWLISLAVTRPLNATVQQLAKVGAMELDFAPTPSSLLTEVDELAVSVNRMKVGLHSFSRYVPTDLIGRVLATGTEPVLGGEERELTIYFCDIVDFVGMAEQLEPDALLHQLGEYLEDLSQGITQTNGTIDKYIGDSIMAFWGAPEPQENHAELACRAMLDNKERMRQLRKQWRERGLPPLYARMAVHTGKVIVGNIGSEQRFNYTVIGDSVNVASRLERLNRLYGTELLISDVTYLAVADKLVVRPIDFVRVKGRKGVVQIFEPLGFRDAMSNKELLHAERMVVISVSMLNHYRTRQWHEVLDCVEQILVLHPEDTVALLFRQRCEEYMKNPPPANWDGVDYTTKF